MFQGTFRSPKPASNKTSNDHSFEASSHWPSGHEGSEQPCSSVPYIAGPAAVQPLNELQWTQSIRSQVCGSGKKAVHRGKAPVSWRELFPSSALLLQSSPVICADSSLGTTLGAVFSSPAASKGGTLELPYGPDA